MTTMACGCASKGTQPPDQRNIERAQKVEERRAAIDAARQGAQTQLAEMKQLAEANK